MKRVIIAALALLFIIGCGKANTVEEQVMLFEQVTTFMRDNDMAGSVSMTSGGNPGVYAKQEFALDTGVIVQATVLFNAGDADVPRDETQPIGLNDVAGDVGPG